jgi:DNA helicase-2/ATP-dependent DNA helicase PcrA
MFKILENASAYKALEKSAPKLMDFAKLINYLGDLAQEVSVETLIRETLERSGYRQMLIDGGEPEQERLDNLDEFISGAINYEQSLKNDPDLTPSLFGFLEENALVADVDKYDDKADAVVLMTVHSSKGLEFPIVFIPGMEDGIFPSMQSITGSDAEIEEERRLAYVAITRAKRELFMVHANCRLLFGKTSYNPVSRFIKEIPDELAIKDRPAGESRRISSLPFDSGDSKPHYEKITISRNIASKPPVMAKKEVFAEGDVVEHMTFGRGEILSVKVLGADTLYEIAFEKVGTKKLMASFAKLKKV